MPFAPASVDAQASAAPSCAIRFATRRTADPDVRELYVTHSDALVDAAVFVRLDDADTSYTYRFPHLAIAEDTRRTGDLAQRFISPAVAIRLPSGVKIADAVLGLLDGGAAPASTCAPDEREARYRDEPSVALEPSAAERAVAPVVTRSLR